MCRATKSLFSHWLYSGLVENVVLLGSVATISRGGGHVLSVCLYLIYCVSALFKTLVLAPDMMNETEKGLYFCVKEDEPDNKRN